MPRHFDDDETDADFSGYYARDTHRLGYGHDYAREDHRAPAGARGDFYGQARSRASYRGVGPRNYQRSDARIADDIHRLLTDDPDLDATDIEVAVQDGEVTLAGSVANRWAKRHAEDVVERCAGIRDIHNRLTIQNHVNLGKASE